MESLDEIKARVESAVPGAKIEIVPNAAVPAQPSLLLDREHALDVAKFLRDDPGLKLDHCSNATGVDWLDRKVAKKVKVKKLVEGVEKEVEETQAEFFPGYLEAVYHLFSMSLKHGPVIIRMRTPDRATGAHLPSLTPIWRSAEFQERGTYEVNGNEVTYKRIVAKNPNVMRAGNSAIDTFRIEGRDTLWLTNKTNQDGPVANPTTTKLSRVE